MGSVEPTVLTVAANIWPDTLREREQWLTWKRTDDGRKIPRAPFAYPNHLDRYVNAHDPDHQTSFTDAQEWAEMLPGHELAYDIRNRDDFPDEDLVLLDYDDVRNPDTGAIHATVREHLDQAGSYGALSTSGAGVHLLGLFPDGFPEGVKTIDSPLDLDLPSTDDHNPADDSSQPDATAFPNAEIEGYDSKRFVGLTGQHITQTPTDLADLTAFIADLCETYATTAEGSPDTHREPERSREELAEMDHTYEIQDVFDAIEHTHPRDIRLRSTVTNERPDSKDLDPSWATSGSGTRLAQFDDGWVYRKGMCGLDALQVVALEESLIRSEHEYPDGKTFFEALEALRERGASIPYYVSADAPDESVSAVDFGPGVDPSADETILTLAGPLQFASTRRQYTCRCPGCEVGLAPDGSHETDCSLSAIGMAQLIDAYQTILTMLDAQPRARPTLRTDAPDWGPVHSQVLDYLCDEETVAPAGGEGESQSYQPDQTHPPDHPHQTQHPEEVDSDQ